MPYSVTRYHTFIVTFVFIVLTNIPIGDTSIDMQVTQEQQRLMMTEEFNGYILMDGGSKKLDVSLTVIAKGEDEYEALIYFDELHGDQKEFSTGEKIVKLEGKYIDYTLRLMGDFPFVLQFINNRYTALDDYNNYMGHLEKSIARY